MVRRYSPQVLDLGLGQKSKTLTKDFDASDEFLRSNDFELGAKSDLFREVSSVRGENQSGAALRAETSTGTSV
jgi:hypothetical protein